MTREEQTTVEAIWKFLGEQERRRTDLRKRDDEWRSEIKTDIKELKAALATVPCVMDDKIKACQDEREAVTQHALTFAADLRAFTLVTVKLAAGAGAITGAVFGVGKLFGWI